MSAIVNVCVDPRLNHEVIRFQVQSKLERMRLRAKRVFITSDIGGNVGSAFTNTAEMLNADDPVVLAAVLHHDDCFADRTQKRTGLEASAAAARRTLQVLGNQATVLTGTVRTRDSLVTWADEPSRRYGGLDFHMPRLSK